MNTVILRVAARSLGPLLLLFSLFLLLRGHDEPGGGFVGGLVASCALVLYGLVHDVGEARRLLRVEPATLIAAGLVAAVGSGSVALVAGDAFLTGRWIELPGGIGLGTPLVFELGVYLVVLGATLSILFTLQEED